MIPDDLGLDNEGIIKAAEELGMTAFKPGRLAASYALGKAIKKAGVLKIGRTMLLKFGDAAATGLDECDEVLEATSDPELKAMILPTKLGFVKQGIEVANSFIRSAELDGNDDSDRPRGVKPFGAGMPAGPVVFAEKAVVNTQINPK